MATSTEAGAFSPLPTDGWKVGTGIKSRHSPMRTTRRLKAESLFPLFPNTYPPVQQFLSPLLRAPACWIGEGQDLSP
jgi:hypothetical protein